MEMKRGREEILWVVLLPHIPPIIVFSYQAGVHFLFRPICHPRGPYKFHMRPSS